MADTGGTIRIVGFDPRWRADFARLNLEWLRRWFVVEPFDEEVLGDPERYILADGGRVLFALRDAADGGTQAVGTVALRNAGDGVYELTKMAVEPALRGAGIGRALLEAAIDAYRGLGGRELYLESSSVAPGTELVSVAVDGVTVGLSICYDLRFPELYRRLAAERGAQVLVVPAAFMLHTGRDHWEVLLRARAIENQCYVLAAGQIGDHEPGRTCFGRSMIIDPWRTVLAQAADATGVTVAEIDLDRVAQIRAELPSLANRRLPA